MNSCEELLTSLINATEVCHSLPAVVKTDTSLLAVGDVHGDVHSVQTAFEIRDRLKLESVAFLGDFVDRGSAQVETLKTLCDRLVEDPDHVFLIRGNHEDVGVNDRYGFIDSILRLKGDSKEVFRALAKFYSALPVALIKKKTAYFAHGGIPFFQDEPFSINEVEKLPPRYAPEDSLLFGILWNDPIEFNRGEQKINQYFHTNWRGENFYSYTEDATRAFLDKIQVKKLVRGHTALREGFKEVNSLTYSIFSGASGSYSGYSPAYLEVSDKFVIHRHS